MGVVGTKGCQKGKIKTLDHFINKTFISQILLFSLLIENSNNPLESSLNICWHICLQFGVGLLTSDKFVF